MKIIILAALMGMLGSTQAIVLKSKSDPVDDPITKDMNALLDKTVFSRNHTRKADQDYLTHLFRSYTTLGADGDGDANGKRVLTEFNAKFAARKILKDWKGLSSNEALDFVEGDKFHGIFAPFDYNKNGTIDQRDAYFWARSLVGETYEGPISTGE